MNIDEAIKKLKSTTIVDEQPFAPDLRAAIKLGIEALKRWQHIRKWCGWKEAPLLPGETGIEKAVSAFPQHLLSTEK